MNLMGHHISRLEILIIPAIKFIVFVKVKGVKLVPQLCLINGFNIIDGICQWIICMAHTPWYCKDALCILV